LSLLGFFFSRHKLLATSVGTDARLTDSPPLSRLQAALRQITDKAREFGAGPLFNQILPLLMSPTLEDQERHLLVKVIDRILYKLDDLVRPYVHKVGRSDRQIVRVCVCVCGEELTNCPLCVQILVVIEPLLIDEDYYARVEGREIISNLAKVMWGLFKKNFFTAHSASCELFSPGQPVRGSHRG